MSTLKFAVVAAMAASVSACKCDPRTSRLSAKIEVIDDAGNPRTGVEFGQVQLNLTSTKKVRIRNTGSVTLNLEKADFSKTVFAGATELPVSVSAGGEYELSLSFTPTVADQRETGTVTLRSNDPQNPTVELALAGSGITASVVVQPTALDFGQVYVGEMKELTFALTNTGSNELPVTSASLTSAVGPNVTANLSPLMRTLAGGESVMVTVRFAPTSQLTLSGELEIVLPTGVGNKSIPIRGTGILAQPKLCFRFDGTAFEQCMDSAALPLNVAFGGLCDERVYPRDGGLTCDIDGGTAPYERSGRMYVRNEGNTPVSYTLSITAGHPSRCDGGASIDFQYANAPTLSDGGAQATWTVPTNKLPAAVTDPKPWETAPVLITYRARSVCRGDDADLSTISWTRQGEPPGTSRAPSSMIATLTGNSMLSDPVPFPVTFSGNSPMPLEVSLVSNTGDGPMRLLNVELWQSADGGSNPGVRCSGTVGGPCQYFAWVSGPTLPVTLEGTTLPGGRVSKPVGRLSYGLLDGGFYYPPSQEQRVFAIVQTSDPYTPTVVVPIVGRL